MFECDSYKPLKDDCFINDGGPAPTLLPDNITLPDVITPPTGMQEYETFLHRFFLGITGLPTVLPTSLPTLEDIQDQLDDLIYGNDSCLVRDEIRCPER